MQTFIYRLNLAPKFHSFANWDAKVQEIFKEHAAYLEKALKSGAARFVGRTDVELKDNFGIVVFTAKDLVEANQFMNGDPAVSSGVMTAQVYPFRVFME